MEVRLEVRIKILRRENSFEQGSQMNKEVNNMARNKKVSVTPKTPQKQQCQSAEAKPAQSATQDTSVSKSQNGAPSAQSAPLTK